MAVFFSPESSADALPSPYPGLRTFNEDESIYFRGRETHIARCIELLAKHRFLMVTGASGDGKSSLVFAGMVPEIRAGFFRAKYAGWAVADFRPERAPLANLAAALAGALLLPQETQSVETELEHGFSALVELYQNSARALPPDHDPADRTAQRTAANLLLIVDQFEEFFTNPENLNGDTPVPAAQTVVNLLLETARLARAHELPLYIVCTMRSDYVGQCVAFAGLAEALGNSHYFVPRLTREEFKQVIREPASLSGCQITERLTERLVFDLHDGQDQLPVLQHALYQIWRAADRGQQPLDLLHYAQVGGLGVDELPAADQPTFRAWLAALPAAYQAFYRRPSLGAVLDTHAETLFAQAGEAGGSAAGRVVEQAFRALTKTDGGRVVRHRVTGRQLVALVNDPAVQWRHVDAVLRAFRLPGNTFIQPFVPEDDVAAPVPLPETAVLDITHESLIRNWRRLAEWAEREAQDVTTWRDLAAQAARWAANQRRRGFLLPIGSYTYFSAWAARFRPTAAWLLRHDLTAAPPEADTQTAATAEVQQPTAQTALATTDAFLNGSRRSLSVTLFWLKYATRRNMLRVGGALALVALIVGYRAWDARRDVTVAREYLERGVELLQSPRVYNREKADFIIAADRLAHFDSDDYLFEGEPTQVEYMLNQLPTDTQRLDVALRIIYEVANNHKPDRRGPNILVSSLIEYQRTILIDVLGVAESNINKDSARFAAYEALMRRTCRLVNVCAYRLSWQEDSVARAALTTSLEFLVRYVGATALARTEPTKSPDPLLVLNSVRLLIAFNRYKGPECTELVEALNPFPEPGRSYTVRSYAGGDNLTDLFPNRPISLSSSVQVHHSGLYWLLSFAAARQGNLPLLTRCLDTLQQHGDLLSQVQEKADGGLAGQLLPCLARTSYMSVRAYRAVSQRLSAHEAVQPAFQEPALTLLAYPTLLHELTEQVLWPSDLYKERYYLNKVAGSTVDYHFDVNLPACFLTATTRKRLWAVADTVMWGLRTQPLMTGAAVSAHDWLTCALLRKFRGLYAIKAGLPMARADEAFTEALRICKTRLGEAPFLFLKVRGLLGYIPSEQFNLPQVVLSNDLHLFLDHTYAAIPVRAFTAAFARNAMLFPRNSPLWQLAGKEADAYLFNSACTQGPTGLMYWGSGIDRQIIPYTRLAGDRTTMAQDSAVIGQLTTLFEIDSTRGWLIALIHKVRTGDAKQALRVQSEFIRTAPQHHFHPDGDLFALELALYDQLRQLWAQYGLTPAVMPGYQPTQMTNTKLRLSVARELVYDPAWVAASGAEFLQPVYELFDKRPDAFNADLSAMTFFVKAKEAEAVSNRLLREGAPLATTAPKLAFAKMRGIALTKSLYEAKRQQPGLLRDDEELALTNGLLHSTLYRRLLATNVSAIDRSAPAGWENRGVSWAPEGIRSTMMVTE